MTSGSLVNKPQPPLLQDQDNPCPEPFNTLTDCGACGVACAPDNVADATCESGTCDYGSCVGTFQDCDGMTDNGCESDGWVDVDHCGGCDYDPCAGPFLDCDADKTNGCEVDGSQDLMNCGQCAKSCGANEFCQNGMCSTTKSGLDILQGGLSIGDGFYVIDPNLGSPADAFEAYCDMTTDNGGWTLLTWTGNSAANSSPPHAGVPYPGLAPCAAQNLACLRGSVVGPPRAEELIQLSSEFVKTQDPSVKTSFGPLSSYANVGKYVYASLATLKLEYSQATCDTSGFANGVFTMLIGLNNFDGMVVYLAQGLRYASYDYSVDINTYIWNVGVTGAHAVWVR